MGFLRKLFRGYKKKKKKPTKAERLLISLDTALAIEKNATKAGMARFHQINGSPSHNSPLLRRNIHRLEKGLSFRPLKPIFGLKFIGETVELMERASQSPNYSQTELKWAHDVLERYFSVVDLENSTIAQAFEIFGNTKQHIQDGITDGTANGCEVFAPYSVGQIDHYANLECSSAKEFDEFHRLCRRRRSQRFFSEAPISLSDIGAAVRAALQAPSACNRQPFDFYITECREKIDAIAAIPFGTAGYGHKLPAIIAVIGDLSNFAEPRDRHLIYIDASLATMQLMLALTTLGLGSVPINWPDVPENHEALRQLLGLESYQVPVMLVGLGKPDPEAIVAYSAKRQVDEVLHVV